eukprot:g3596.t1
MEMQEQDSAAKEETLVGEEQEVDNAKNAADAAAAKVGASTEADISEGEAMKTSTSEYASSSSSPNEEKGQETLILSTPKQKQNGTLDEGSNAPFEGDSVSARRKKFRKRRMSAYIVAPKVQDDDDDDDDGEEKKETTEDAAGEEKKNDRMQRVKRNGSFLLGSGGFGTIADMDDEEVPDELSDETCKGRYHQIMTTKLKPITSHSVFGNFITGVILVAGVLVGYQTYPLDESTVETLNVVDAIILAIFTSEVVLKLFAEGRRPLRYFNDGWNRFDFFIVAAAFTPGINEQATMLRLLRLLRVLKLLRALPELQIIVISLLSSFSSLGYISMLMTMLFYLFAIIAVMLFGGNDTLHFGTVHIAFLSLWRAATGEDWTELMYQGMYGCNGAEYGLRDSASSELCPNPSKQYFLAVVFHIVFNIFAGLILLNLMVGVIIGSIFEAKAGIEGDYIRITIERAKNLKVADLITIGGLASSDPFVVTTVGDQRHKTKVIKNNLNPVWDDTHDYQLDADHKNKIKFEVFDWDRFGSPDSLGSFTLSFSNLRWNKPTRFELELDGVDTGELIVMVKRCTGPNHIMSEADKDTWDFINDKYYACREIMKEVKDLLEQRKIRREKFEAEKRAKRRWQSVRQKTLRGQVAAQIVDVVTAKASTGKPSKEEISKLYGNNSVFGFKDRKLRKN